MRVKARPKVLEAIKYNGTNGGEIIASVEDGKVVSSDPLILDTDVGAVKVQFGGWVIFEGSDVVVETPVSFLRKYSIVEEWV